jgi:membrane protein implicated in regulation of membrane protease activity
VPSNYSWEISMAGCATTFAELMLWVAILWAIFGGCRGCVFVGFVFLLASLIGWQTAGWIGATLAIVSVWALWHMFARLARKMAQLLPEGQVAWGKGQGI